ncbi:unnamed protein product [Closterium sp. NIES-64]|nr:unnamed protein product [Closterium sp. NIES-64]
MQRRPRQHRSYTQPFFRPPCPSSALLSPSLSPNFLFFLPPAQRFLPPSFPLIFPSVPRASRLPFPSIFLLSPPVLLVPLRPPPSLSFPSRSNPSNSSPSLFLCPPFILFFRPPFPLLPPVFPPPFPMLPTACHPPALLCAAPVLRRRAWEGTACTLTSTSLATRAIVPAPHGKTSTAMPACTSAAMGVVRGQPARPWTFCEVA